MAYKVAKPTAVEVGRSGSGSRHEPIAALLLILNGVTSLNIDMKKAVTEKIQMLSKLTAQPPSAIGSALLGAPAIIQDCVAELFEEIRRLQRQNIKQEVAYFPALEKEKAKNKSKYKVVINIPDNHRAPVKK